MKHNKRSKSGKRGPTSLEKHRLAIVGLLDAIVGHAQETGDTRLLRKARLVFNPGRPMSDAIAKRIVNHKPQKESDHG